MLKLISQYVDVGLSLAFMFMLIRLKLQVKYLPISIFILFDSLSALLYIACTWLIRHHVISFDYRIFWCSTTWIEWATTLWVVYALLIAILDQLPGIRRFSLRLLTFVILISFTVAIATVGPEYTAAKNASNAILTRLTVVTAVVDRALSMAELLAIVAILTFVLRFPIRVPRNLATFSAGLSTYLFFSIGFLLFRTYGPTFAHESTFNSIPGYLIGICVIYWVISINKAGEVSQVTLGRGWQSVPKEHLVRQLEAMNAALLQAREQT